MKHNTGIEWTHFPGYIGETWNPLRGCSYVNEGCRNCYAARDGYRFSTRPEDPWNGFIKKGRHGPEWTGKVETLPHKLLEPARWDKPRSIFVNSTSDLFHEKVPWDFIDQVFAVMAMCPRHIFIVLTKRPALMKEYLKKESARHVAITNQYRAIQDRESKSLTSKAPAMIPFYPYNNILLGASCHDQGSFDEIWEQLRQITWYRKIVSYEPALGPINFKWWDPGNPQNEGQWMASVEGVDLQGKNRPPAWLIMGGESGPNARPLHPEWVKDTRNQCRSVRVPFFFKQWGEWGRPDPIDPEDGVKAFDGVHVDDGYGNYEMMVRMGKKKAGRKFEGQEWSEFPKMGGVNEKGADFDFGKPGRWRTERLPNSLCGS